MLLKNLVKKLIDKMSLADNNVYIELYSHDKEKDELKLYKFNIVDVDEGGHVGSEEYTKIVGKLNSCVEVDSDYVLSKGNELEFGRFVPKYKAKKVEFLDK
jgi:hypothetical protein|tara:strand:+ start:6532 stop:6834 length:303 start_codon:yes stop_codon:yes gene_type:complete